MKGTNHTGACKTISTRRGTTPRRYVIKRVNIMTLPVECIYNIFSKLPHPQRLKFGLTCRLMRSVSMLFHETIFNPVRAFAECEDPSLGELFSYIPDRLTIGFSDIDSITIVKSKTKEIIAVHMRDVSMISAYFAAAELGDIDAAAIVHSIGSEQDGKEAQELCFSASYIAADAGYFKLANWFRRNCSRKYNREMSKRHADCNTFTYGLVNRYSINLNKWLLGRGEVTIDKYYLASMVSHAKTVNGIEWCSRIAERIGCVIYPPSLFTINELVRNNNVALLEWYADRYPVADHIKQCYEYCTSGPMCMWINKYLGNTDCLPPGAGSKIYWHSYDSYLLKPLLDKGHIKSVRFFNIICDMDERGREENKKLVDILIRLPCKYVGINKNIIDYNEHIVSDCTCGINAGADNIVANLLMAAAILSDLELLDYIRCSWDKAFRNMCDSNYHVARKPFYIIIEDICKMLRDNYHTISRESLNWICYWYDRLIPDDHAAMYPFRMLVNSTTLRAMRIGHKSLRARHVRRYEGHN